MVDAQQQQHDHHGELSVMHYSITDPRPAVTVKVEKNSRGHNWEVSVSGAHSVDEALELLRTAESKLRAEYGETAP